MEISINIRSEIVVVILAILFIMLVHILFSCCTVPIYEGFEKMVTNTKKAPVKEPKKSKDGKKVKEGFTGANTNNGESSSYNLYDDVPVNTASWFTPNLTYANGKPNKASQNIYKRPAQPVPLPEGEMVFLANNQFKPECCPNAYSTGSGCACMTVDQYKYIVHRGGNNVPYSEY